MGCPSETELDGTLVFSVTIHDPDTGNMIDADTVPTYRVYEDETTTAIATGSMAKLDDGNTTGLYSEQLTCSTANGFETGKTYTIHILGTVGGVTGSITFVFKVMSRAANVWAYATRTLTQAATQIAAIVAGTSLTIHRGDTLALPLSDLADNTGWEKLWFTIKITNKEDDDDALVQVVLSNPTASGDGLVWIEGAAATAANGSITVLSSTSVQIDIEAVETAKLTPRTGAHWDIQMLIGDTVTTIAAGRAAITGDISRAVA